VRKAASFLLPALLLVKDLPACSVCFGDPKSPLTLGAKAGVFFLLGVVGVVLGGILAVTIFWMRRAKLVAVQNLLHHQAGSPNQEHVVESI
jgi:hypothetical protein